LIHNYRTRENWVLLGIASLFVVCGLLILIARIPEGRGWGAIIGLLSFALAVYTYFLIKNKSISVSGDRIEMVTVTGRTLSYGGNQITCCWWRDPDGKGQKQMDGYIRFEDGFRFTFATGISDYRSLTEELRAIAPPATLQREPGPWNQ
jgi:hypothetical protein